MTLNITDRLIRSPATAHTAKLIGQGDTAGWRVSWLPDRILTQAEAEVAIEGWSRMPSALLWLRIHLTVPRAWCVPRRRG